MEFGINHTVIVGTMTKQEASVFIKFLELEIRRHQMDIEDIMVLIKRVMEMYEL